MFPDINHLSNLSVSLRRGVTIHLEDFVSVPLRRELTIHLEKFLSGLQEYVHFSLTILCELTMLGLQINQWVNMSVFICHMTFHVCLLTKHLLLFSNYVKGQTTYLHLTTCVVNTITTSKSAIKLNYYPSCH